MYKMCFDQSIIKQAKRWEDWSNKISQPKISLVFVWQTLGGGGGGGQGACGVSAGDFRDYAGWLRHPIAGSASKLSKNPDYIVSGEKPAWHGPNPHLVQEGQYILLYTELIRPIHQFSHWYIDIGVK